MINKNKNIHTCIGPYHYTCSLDNFSSATYVILSFFKELKRVPLNNNLEKESERVFFFVQNINQNIFNFKKYS